MQFLLFAALVALLSLLLCSMKKSAPYRMSRVFEQNMSNATWAATEHAHMKRPIPPKRAPNTPIRQHVSSEPYTESAVV